MRGWRAPLLAVVAAGTAAAAEPPPLCGMLHDPAQRGLYVDCAEEWMNPGALDSLNDALNALREGRLEDVPPLLEEATRADVPDAEWQERFSGLAAGALLRTLAECPPPAPLRLSRR